MTDDHPSAGDPEYDGFRISEIWAFTAVDPADDQEGIITLASPSGPLPMIASDKVRLADFSIVARRFADQNGMEVKLRRFTLAEEVETFTPFLKCTEHPGRENHCASGKCGVCWLCKENEA